MFPPWRTTPSVGAPYTYGTMASGFSATNPFVAFYGNPMAPGPTGRFDEPLSQIAATANATLSGGGAASIGAAAGTSGPIAAGGAVGTPAVSLSDILTAQGLLGQSATVVGAAAPGAAELGTMPTLAGPQITLNVSAASLARPPITKGPRPGAGLEKRDDLQQILARSTTLASKKSIQVLSDGRAIVLRGVVANEHDRRVAEALLRISPGVDEVRNELTISP
jgi:hypothetical protein